jgi:fluoroacetyl-CoA thioesterase
MPGLRGHATHTITDADTAIAMRSGEVPTLATPRLVALMEEATIAALADNLGEGETSVGPRSWPKRSWRPSKAGV